MSLRAKRLALLLCAVLPGAGAALVSAWFLRLDFLALRRAFPAFEAEARLAQEGVTQNTATLAAAEGLQNAYRLNCFADGVGALLGLILVAIGLHGLCLLPSSESPRTRPEG